MAPHYQPVNPLLLQGFDTAQGKEQATTGNMSFRYQAANWASLRGDPGIDNDAAHLRSILKPGPSSVGHDGNEAAAGASAEATEEAMTMAGFGTRYHVAQGSSQSLQT
jgi:hypothetical protein